MTEMIVGKSSVMQSGPGQHAVFSECQNKHEMTGYCETGLNKPRRTPPA